MSAWNIGVHSFAVDHDNTSFGVFGAVNSSGSNGPIGSVNYAIYGQAVGTGQATSYAGYFQGDVRVTGTFANPSDASLKESVQPLASTEGVLPWLMRLRPQSFVYVRSPEYEHMSLPDGEHFGLIAQKVEEVFPNLVEDEVHPADFSDDEEGEAHVTGEPIHYKSVNYIEMIPLLLQAIQEQQGQIEEQRTEIEALKVALGRRLWRLLVNSH